jgi:hypothetical protein
MGAPTATPVPPPLVRDDPYAAFDDLMCVMEALCPVWPQRPTTARLNVLIL